MTGRTIANQRPPLRLPAAAWYHHLRYGPEPSACPRRCRSRRCLQHLPQNQGSNPLLGRPHAYRIRTHELGHREVSTTDTVPSVSRKDNTKSWMRESKCGEETSLSRHTWLARVYFLDCRSEQRISRTRQYLISRLTYSTATSTSTPSRVAWSTPTTRSKRIDYIRGGSFFFFLRTRRSTSINCNPVASFFALDKM